MTVAVAAWAEVLWLVTLIVVVLGVIPAVALIGSRTVTSVRVIERYVTNVVMQARETDHYLAVEDDLATTRERLTALVTRLQSPTSRLAVPPPDWRAP